MKGLSLLMMVMYTAKVSALAISKYQSNCLQCMIASYQFCLPSTCQSIGDVCNAAIGESTNIYDCPSGKTNQLTTSPCNTAINIGNNRTADNKVYIDMYMTSGKWCYI